jgi:hypothetical protein
MTISRQKLFPAYAPKALHNQARGALRDPGLGYVTPSA